MNFSDKNLSVVCRRGRWEFSSRTAQVRIQELWLGGGVDFFSPRHGVWGPPKGPQWVQSNALVGAQGAKPPETPEF